MKEMIRVYTQDPKRFVLVCNECVEGSYMHKAITEGVAVRTGIFRSGLVGIRLQREIHTSMYIQREIAGKYLDGDWWGRNR